MGGMRAYLAGDGYLTWLGCLPEHASGLSPGTQKEMYLATVMYETQGDTARHAPRSLQGLAPARVRRFKSRLQPPAA